MPESVRTRRWDALLVGVLAVVLGAAGSWIPSFWYDEVATLHSGGRSPSDLWRMLGNIDAVHGLYYAGMHYWLGAFGPSEFSARLPSALAVGAAAAGVVVLGARLGTRRLGVVSGVVFVLLPRVGWAAVEARGYALTVAAAVWLTVILVAAPTVRGRWRRAAAWSGYAVALAVSIVLFAYLATMIAAHLLTLLARKEVRSSWRGWSVAAAAGTAGAAPFLAVVRAQSGQVGWIPPLDSHLPRALAEYQWFVGAPGFAVAFGVLLVVAAVVTATRGGDGTWRRVLAVAVPWTVVPTAALLIYSVVESPMYLDRYVAFTTPAAALLGGLALTRITARWWTTTLTVAVFAALVVPGYLAQRGPYAKPSGMDFSEVNRFAGEHLRPGDCVLFGAAAWNPASQRLVEDVRPAAFDGVRDLGAGRTAASEGSLWELERAVTDPVEPLASCQALWYFTDQERDATRTVRHTSNELWTLPPHHFEDTAQFAEFTRAGLRIEDRWSFNVTQVVLLRPQR
ncbi:mannosyltransferase [Rhodococcus spelaei]|uniref:Mannosyltransferase n=1 Tax=Rhodococcus spelaei TaxID=2546320 RepID=A0A541BR88_9NOCA|nr:mannosyltransferase [Rhodococcus spelaei]TQF74844.1 mannosyltransferase [Rhodococcus spelaei]